MLSFSPRDVLGEVWDLIESVSEDFFMLKAFGYDMSNFHLLVVALFLYFCERKCLIV